MYVWSYLVFFIKASLLLWRLSLRRRYDIVHVHNMPNLLVFAAMGPKLMGARVMLDVHDLMTANYMAKFHTAETCLAVKILKIEQRFSAMFADHVFCADHNQQDYLSEKCGVRREKITVLMNLPNVDLFRPVAGEKSASVFRMIYHGTMAYRLGIDLIIKALAKASERIPVELWLYGSGDYLPEALALASELGLEQKVHFSRKFFPVEQIPQMVSGMDLGVIGNRRNLACDKYMLPVKLLEYVYLGVPVIAPRLDVIMRYFDDTMVRYYEPENVEQMTEAIVALYQDYQERERQSQAALRFYRTHNNEAQAKLYLDLLTTSCNLLSAHGA
jgi:glycosyltransferase involved in cell wall biosynthesis